MRSRPGPPSRQAAARTVFLSAGETSGDLHGAALARELMAADPGLRLVGLGGRRMEAAGVSLLADLDQLAVMGFAEVARRASFFLGLRRRVRRFLASEGVDLVIPIDYPGFNLWLAERARRLGARVLYFIAPQVWAWREGRARRLAETCDLVCVVLPFESELLASYGAEVCFVGHPLLDHGPQPRPAPTGEPLLGLFPGSRPQEVERILPSFVRAAARVRARREYVRAVVGWAPDVPASLYGPAEGLPLLPAEEAIGEATAALTKSGTITLELALAGVPMVVGYRTSPATYWIARRLVDVEHIALVNLVAGRRLVPELVQNAVTPEALAAAISPFLEPKDPERARVVEGLAGVVQRLGSPGCARRVAGHALELLAE